MAKKTGKGYFIEFLMLFLAVSFGFLADNFREKLSERNMEKDYIQSMIEDVNEDRKNIATVISKNSKRVIYLDSLINSCFTYDGSKKARSKINSNYPQVIFHPEFLTPIELTMQQLKNAGGMRLIKSKKSINEIIRYDSKAKELANQQQYYEKYQNNAIDIGTKIFNIQKIITQLQLKNPKLSSFNLELITEDKTTLNELANNVVMYKGVILYYIQLLNEMTIQGEVLEQALKKEYSF